MTSAGYVRARSPAGDGSVLAADWLRFRLQPQPALQAADRTGGAASVLFEQKVRGAAVGAAEQALGSCATKPPLGVTASTELGGGVWCALEHSVPFGWRRNP